MSLGFEVAVRSGGRVCTDTIHTLHGDIRTLVFIPIGTETSVKAVLPEAMADLGAQMLLANAYHLYLQLGSDLVDETGGLGYFINWSGLIFTDSGEFQVMSLDAGFKEALVVDTKGFVGNNVIAEGKTRRAHVNEDGVTFFSRLNGSRLRFTPEVSMIIQHQPDTDIMSAFDELTTLMNTHDYQEASVAHIRWWTVQCLRAHTILIEERVGKPYQALLGVIQGVQYEDLRRRATADLTASEVDGFRFDGFGLGGTLEKKNLGRIIGWMINELPEDRPWYLLGISEPEGLLEAVAFRADTFDCVSPSRVARNVAIYTIDGRYSVNTTRNRRAFEPLEAGYDRYTYAYYTRAYLRHLFKTKETLASTLATIHSERFMVRLVDEIRASLGSGESDLFRSELMGRYNARRTQ